MNKKYELTEETKTIKTSHGDDITLYRIKALKDFGDVKKGDLGGWIEKEENLSHIGDCWVSENALVWGNAIVYGDAEVCGDAKVYENAEVYGDAEVCGNAKVYGDALVHGHAKMYDNAMACDHTEVYGCAEVFGNAVVYGDTIVLGNAKVYENARVYGNARVFGNAKVYENARVYGNARVFRNARVFGNSELSGNVRLSTGANIGSNSDYIVIGPIGSRDAYTTVYRTQNTDTDYNIRIQCGCFNGTPDEFFTRVNSVYKKGTLYHSQLTFIITAIVVAMIQTSEY